MRGSRRHPRAPEGGRAGLPQFPLRNGGRPAPAARRERLCRSPARGRPEPARPAPPPPGAAAPRPPRPRPLIPASAPNLPEKNRCTSSAEQDHGRPRTFTTKPSPPSVPSIIVSQWVLASTQTAERGEGETRQPLELNSAPPAETAGTAAPREEQIRAQIPAAGSPTPNTSSRGRADRPSRSGR